MHLQYLPLINSKHIILASGSPRRKQALDLMQIKYEVIVSKYPENLNKKEYKPEDYVMENSKQKGLEVFNRLQEEGKEVDLVISADTVVIHNNEILEKPKDSDDAIRMLSSLNNSDHTVATGVTLIYFDKNKQQKMKQFVETTIVTFANLSKKMILSYVATGSPLDKAGGYGIQDIGTTLISHIKGCYWNVVGFPIHKFAECLVDTIEEDWII